MEISKINYNGQNYNIKDTSARTILADDYNSGKQYVAGDFCLYGNALYECISNTTGSWNSSAWNGITIADELSNINSVLEEVL